MPRKDGEAQLAHEEDSDSESEQVLLTVTTNSDPDSSDQWYLDTGCSNI